MKLEIGESLGYSFLRHVKGCWLVQTNWKASEHWDKLLSDEKLEQEFANIRDKLESPGSDFQGTFKGTAKCSQFLKQAEIDIVGVQLDGSIHTVEVAFHENGLDYRGGGLSTDKNVLKKMLRTMLLLRAYHSDDIERHIYFASPKVGPRVQMNLENAFDWLGQEYPATHWHLVINNGFTEQFLMPLRARAHQVADTSELFLRSLQLLELSGSVNLGNRD